jgi:hypothetical protein
MGEFELIWLLGRMNHLNLFLGEIVYRMASALKFLKGLDREKWPYSAGPKPMVQGSAEGGIAHYALFWWLHLPQLFDKAPELRDYLVLLVRRHRRPAFL